MGTKKKWSTIQCGGKTYRVTGVKPEITTLTDEEMEELVNAGERVQLVTVQRVRNNNYYKYVTITKETIK